LIVSADYFDPDAVCIVGEIIEERFNG